MRPSRRSSKRTVARSDVATEAFRRRARRSFSAPRVASAGVTAGAVVSAVRFGAGAGAVGGRGVDATGAGCDTTGVTGVVGVGVVGMGVVAAWRAGGAVRLDAGVGSVGDGCAKAAATSRRPPLSTFASRPATG